MKQICIFVKVNLYLHSFDLEPINNGILCPVAVNLELDSLGFSFYLETFQKF